MIYKNYVMLSQTLKRINYFKLNPVLAPIYLLRDWFYDARTILATQQELKDIRNVFNEDEG